MPWRKPRSRGRLPWPAPRALRPRPRPGRRSRLQVGDQPGPAARRALRRGRVGPPRPRHPRHRADGRGAANAGGPGRGARRPRDVRGARRAARRWDRRLRPRRHRDALRAAGGGTRRRSGRVRRRSARPGAADGHRARRPARAGGPGGGRSAAVHAARHRGPDRRGRGDRRVGVVAVRLGPAALGRPLRQGRHRPPLHRGGHAGPVPAAHRDDRGDAARGWRRRAGRRPTRGASRPDRSRRGTGPWSPTCPTPPCSSRPPRSPAAR